MPTNNRRKNPFTLAPALTFVVLAFFVFAALFGKTNPIISGVLTLVVFGAVLFGYLYLRGNLILRIPNRPISGRGFWVALFCAVLMIVWSALWQFGILRELDTLAVPPNSFWEAIMMIITAAVIPAVMEEYFFRGVVMLEYRFAGVFGASFFSALLFAAIKLSLSSFFLYFVCGLLLSLTVFVTGDIKMAVVARFLYQIYLIFGERRIYLLAYDDESRVLFITIFTSLALLALYGLLRNAELLLRERAGEEPPVCVPKGKGFFVFYDIVSAPSLWLVMLGFLLFTLLNHFL